MKFGEKYFFKDKIHSSFFYHLNTKGKGSPGSLITKELYCGLEESEFTL